MNKYVVIALIVSVVAAVAAYRYYGPCCLCSGCPCAQNAVVEEVVVVDVPAEEVVAQDEAVTSEKSADCCCGQACADEKHNDVK